MKSTSIATFLIVGLLTVTPSLADDIDYDAVRRVCLEHRPKLLMCGYSAYPRTIDFARFRAIADSVGAFLLAVLARRWPGARRAHPGPC